MPFALKFLIISAILSIIGLLSSMLINEVSGGGADHWSFKAFGACLGILGVCIAIGLAGLLVAVIRA